MFKANRMIDLRSDTVTLPSPPMRQAMAQAVVGDDVYGEDPTVNHLQELVAEQLGKEAALFVASGTMGNLVSLLAHCARGDDVILGDESHIFHYEQGGASSLGSLVFHTVPTTRAGELPLAAIEGALRDPDDAHAAIPGIICLESTHNRCGGVPLSLEYHQAVEALAQRYKLPVHLDGARLPNAAVALGVSMRDIAQHTTSVQLDLSKGLGAPIGGVVAGPSEFIRRAHRWRKAVGGGMRQAGIVAAAGIYALEHMVERLADDHHNAQVLAEGLATFGQIEIDPAQVRTNIVIFRLRDKSETPDAFIAAMREHGVLLGMIGGDRLRMVTHDGIGSADINAVLQAVGRVLRSQP
jgi:threonine aldolase